MFLVAQLQKTCVKPQTSCHYTTKQKKICWVIFFNLNKTNGYFIFYDFMGTEKKYQNILLTRYYLLVNKIP